MTDSTLALALTALEREWNHAIDGEARATRSGNDELATEYEARADAIADASDEIRAAFEASQRELREVFE